MADPYVIGLIGQMTPRGKTQSPAPMLAQPAW